VHGHSVSQNAAAALRGLGLKARPLAGGIAEWRERGGPMVEVPKRQGFGTRFIEGSVASELQGQAKLDYDPAGLVCTMEIPLDAVVPDIDGNG